MDVIRAFDAFVEDLSNWYIRRSRRRFWDGDEIALRTLWYALVTSLRVVSPVLPFLAEHLWRTLTRARPRRSRLRLPRRLAGRPRTRRRAARGGRRRAARRRARASGPAERLAEGAPAAAAARRRGCAARAGPCGRDRGRAARQVRRVRARGRDRAAREAEPALCSGLGSARRSAQCAPRSRPATSRSSATGRFRVLEHELGPDDVLVERDRQGRMVGRVDGRRRPSRWTRRSTRSSSARGASTSSSTRSTRCAGTSGLELTDRIVLDDPRGRRGPARSRGVDQGGDAGRRDPPWRGARDRRSPDRRVRSQGRSPETSSSSRRSSTGSRKITSSSAMRERLDRLDAAGAEPVAGARDELLGRGRARGDPDRLDAVEPGLVDLGLVVDQVRLHAARARDLDEAVRVGRVARADHEQQLDLGEHLLDRPLAVGGRVADVLLLRAADVAGSVVSARR